MLHSLLGGDENNRSKNFFEIFLGFMIFSYPGQKEKKKEGTILDERKL